MSFEANCSGQATSSRAHTRLHCLTAPGPRLLPKFTGTERTAARSPSPAWRPRAPHAHSPLQPSPRSPPGPEHSAASSFWEAASVTARGLKCLVLKPFPKTFGSAAEGRPHNRGFGFVTLSVRTLPARGKPHPGHGPTAPCPAELAPPGTSPSGQRGVPKGHHRQVKGPKVPRETGDFGVDLAGHGDAGGRPHAAPQVQRPSPETLCSHPERGFYTSCEETCLIIYI